MEQIYTIPVNEAFEASAADKSCGCPFCALYNKLENDELELILGASMMEPEIRRETNEHGFCSRHFRKMFGMKNRLGLALMLESHLESLKKEVKTGNIFSRDIASKSVDRIEKLSKTCYVCFRIEDKISKMFTTAAYLYNEEKDFRENFKEVKYFCLPHYREYMLAAKNQNIHLCRKIIIAQFLCKILSFYLLFLQRSKVHEYKTDVQVFPDFLLFIV